MASGDRLPPERRGLRDETTGATIRQLTDAPAITHNPYFLNNAWAYGGRIIVTSYRGGGPDLYAIDEASGEICQLTDGGTVNPWSACVSLDGRTVFFTSGSQVRAVDVATAATEVVVDFGVATRPGNCSLRPDGREVVTCVRDDRQQAVIAVATDGSGYRTIHETDDLLAHAQFSPDGRYVLYASNLPRLWIVDADGRNNRVLRQQSRQEWITHESWLNADEVIFSYWPHGLRAIRRDGTGERVIATFSAWHPAARRDGSLIVCDTTLPDIGLQLVDPHTGAHQALCYPGASCQGYQWREPEPIWEGPVPEEAYGPQWTHPHPSFSPDGRQVLFTSDRTGTSQVYTVFLP